MHRISTYKDDRAAWTTRKKSVSERAWQRYDGSTVELCAITVSTDANTNEINSHRKALCELNDGDH